jgi:hypothetical protein
MLRTSFQGVLALGAALQFLGCQQEQAADRAIQVGDEIIVTARVVGIDRENRSILIEGPDGDRVPIQAPDPAPNFDRIELGDDVTIRYNEAVALAIRPAVDAEPGITGLAAVSTAPPGATPGGVVFETVERTAIVRAVDPAERTVTLDVPAGYLVKLDVDETLDLTNVRVGEKVSVTHTQAIALQITPPAE